ncbi:MAG: hypothetical protein C4576_03660 [Desulfobacteraceae bacterium]|nr:MAG: hypothetical protein C4576_03660 [Desulfobacteraceae bacterium]
MGKNIFQDKSWQMAHLSKIRKRAGNRYTPELNVDLPIGEVFDGLCRTRNFYNLVRSNYGKLNREFGHVSSTYEDRETQKIYQNLLKEISSLSEDLSKLKDYSTNDIPWGRIEVASQRATEILWDLSRKLREENAKAEKQKESGGSGGHRASERRNFDIHHLYETQKVLGFFQEQSSSTAAGLSNSPFLLLTGAAGTGKTHLLCDVVEHHIAGQTTLPAVLFFGELFGAGDPFAQMIKQLDLQLSSRRFLSLMNSAGKQSSCRAIIAIDALNETRKRGFWKRNLAKVINAIRKYPHIALVVSVRSGFEDEVLTKNTRRSLLKEEHRGFQFREWEAVSKFFSEFGLPLPEIPLLMPEFQNPLFLLLFCKAFRSRSRSNSPKRQVFRGHEGATYIFENFVDSVSKRISRQFNIDNGPGKNIWDAVIERIAADMVEQNDDRVSEDQFFTIVKDAYPSIDHSLFTNELERNLLIVKIPRYSTGKRVHDEFDYRFPFQKFSDHLLGRYLFKNYEKEFGKSNKNLETAKRYFSKRRKIGKFLSRSWNRGIIEALSIQCPEHLKGCELFEVAPYLRKSEVFQEAFIESLIWRKPDAFSTDLKSTLDYINGEIVRTEGGHNSLLNALLAVAPIPNHPLNADFLHRHLSKFSMAKRDSWWSTFLHYQYGEKEAVDRLIEWGWSEQNKAHLNDESVRLCCTASVWFLTSSNRSLRDRSTKALVALLTGRLAVVKGLLVRFHDVNDPYVSERLLAIAYGCAIRSRKDKDGLKSLSEWVYEKVFKDGNPPVDILLRDHARGIIVVALNEGIGLHIDPERIEPPFNSEWPETVPSEEFLKEKYYPELLFEGKSNDRGFLNIWSSVMYNFGSLADFGNYVLNSAVRHWSGRRLNSNDVNRKILFDSFRRRLSRDQRELLEKAINPFSGVDLSSILESIETFVHDDDQDTLNVQGIKKQKEDLKLESKRTFADFKDSLSNRKRTFFECQIEPFLENGGRINDPLESFDTGTAQRWLFNRVVDLGWKPELHGRFDDYLRSQDFGRSERKAERIGKKYQWIALSELLARISDNFQLNGETWSDGTHRYEGPWQVTKRNIDPTCILKDFPNRRPNGIPGFDGHERYIHYDAWEKAAPDSGWLRKVEDLPNPKNIVELIDDQGNHWLMLEGFVEWEDETPPEKQRYDMPTRRLYYMIRSYLVPKRSKNKVLTWAMQQRFMGRWMPESHAFYQIHLGEYPWAPSFLYHYIPYYNHDGWTNDGRENKLPAKVLVTDDEYLSSGSSVDCSTTNPIRVKLPAKFLVDEMNLAQQDCDGRFFDSDGCMVAFDPSVFNLRMPGCVLIRKDKFCSFLEGKQYGIVWTLLGEKNLIGGGRTGQPLGRLEIDGAYTLCKKREIIGARNNSFKCPE